MKRCELARDYFKQGYACSQALALAFIDLTDLSEEQISKLTLPLGGGLGRQRLTCGAINSMAMIVGFIFSKNENSHENKLYVYEIVQELSNRFIKEYNTLNCAELLKNANLEVEIGGKPEERTSGYYDRRPCEKIVYACANILEEYLKEKNIL